MRRIFLATIALVFAGTAGAFAADLPRAMPPAAKAPVFVPGFTWTGFYVGINGGYGWGNSDWNGFPGSADASGALLGATAGYNWQVNSLVFGLEGDLAWSNMRGSFASLTCPLGCETRNNWLGTVRGRVGVAMDRFMPYVTGGVAFGDVEARPAGFAGVSEVNAGWTVGGGIEAALGANWSAKLEYLYVDFGSVNCSTVACGLPTDVDMRSNVVRAGLNLRF